jgi:acyl-CoA thioester hydrolase
MVRKVSFEQPVYTYDIDYAGHVSNIVYLRWMETARAKLLEAAGKPVQELLREGIVPILAGTTIEYRRPILLDDRIRVEIWLSRMQGATARIEVRFFDDDGRLAATGWHRGVFINAETKRPVRVPTVLRSALEPFLEGMEGGRGE